MERGTAQVQRLSSAADAHHRGRPGWPAAAFEAAAGGLALYRDGAVRDLAAGIGRLTRLLVRRFTRALPGVA